MECHHQPPAARDRLSLDAGDLRGDAGDGSAQDGVGKVPLGTLQGHACLDELGILLDRQIDVAPQLVAYRRLLLLQLLEEPFGDGQRHARFVEVGGRADAIVEQRGLAVELGLIGCHALARELDLLGQALVRALEVVEIAPDAGQLGLGLLGREAIGRGIDREQLVARRQLLAFDDGDAHHLARHLRRDEDFLGADIGVVGRHVAPARQVEEESDRRDQRRDDHHQGDAQ